MIYAFDEYEFDSDGLELRKAGRVVKAEALVLRLLAVLVREAGRLVSKDDLVEELWDGRAVADNVVTVAVARLRKTLGARRGERELVTSVYGRGYRFVRPVTIRELLSPPVDGPVSDEVGSDRLFVGRDRVMQRLRAAFERAREGRGQLCVIMGEPGIGKTRVVEALERELPAESARVVWGFCREAGDTPPLWPFLPVLRQLLASPELAASPDGALLSSVLTTFGARARDADEAQAVVGSASRHHTFDAIARALRGAAREAPWLIVLDDLHRADAASLELLSLLVDEIARARLLIVATLRPIPGRASPRSEGFLSHVLGHRNCERVSLERLRPEEVAAYVAALVDDPEGKLGAAVYERSEGNPFYMTEVARQLGQGDDPDTAALSVPGAALDLIRQRVALLDRSCREVLTAAAVIGRSFELSLLQMVTGTELRVLMANLDEAIEADLVVAASESATAFAFGHDLMRAVLYDSIQPAERRALHVRVAEALETRSLSNAVPPSELAYHLHAALPASDPRKTVHYCRMAAAASASAWAHTEAARYYLQALSALNLMEQPSGRLRLSFWYAITIYGRGDASAEFLRAIDEATRLAREQRNGPMLVRAGLARNQHPELKTLPGARAALEEGLALLTEDDNEGWRGVALMGLACLAPHCYDAQRTRTLLDEGLPFARAAGSRAALFAAFVCRLHALGGPQYESESEAIASELEELGRQHPDRNQLLPLYLAQYRAFSALQRGDGAALNVQLQRALTRAREVRYGQQLWHLERCRLLVQINGEAPHEAVGALEALHRRGEQRCIGGAALFTAFDRAVVLPELGLAPPSFDAGLAAVLSVELDDPPHIWAIKARALAELREHGASDLAHAALRHRQPNELANLACDSQFLGTIGQLTRAALALDATEYFRPLHALLARYPKHYAANIGMFSEGAIPGLMGMLSLALGERARASAELEAGLLMNQRAGLVLRSIELRLLIATCAREPGAANARAHAARLRESQEEAARLGFGRVAQRAAALIGEPAPALRAED